MVATARPRAGPPRPYNFPAFERGELANGAQLVVCTVPRLPLVTLLTLVDGGSSADPEGREGVARVTAKLLAEGTLHRAGAELADDLENLGTALGTSTDWDSSIASITFLREHLDEVAGVLSEVILEPTFPERELQRLKAERVADLLQIESEPRALADLGFDSFLFAPGSRFAIPNGGSKESVSAVSREDVRHFHSRTHLPAATTFIAAGDVAFTDLKRALDKKFGGPSPSMPNVFIRRNEIAATTRRLRIIDKPGAPQSELRVGHAGLPRKHPDYFPVVVMNAIFGGLFGSRINLNLREAHGYTYGASSHFDWRRDTGPFVISTAVQTEVTAAALTEILFEIDSIRANGVSTAELSLAKEYLEGVFPIRYETTPAIAAALGNMIVHGLPTDYYDSYRGKIQAVTAEQVANAAQRHLKPDMLQTLIVGDASAVGGSVSALGLGQLTPPPVGQDIQ